MLHTTRPINSTFHVILLRDCCARSWRQTCAIAILRIFDTAKKTNEWILNKAGVKRELLDTVKAKTLAYYGHTMRKQGSCLEKEIMQEQCQVHAGEE